MKNWRSRAANPNKRHNRIYSKNHGNFIRLRKTTDRSILFRNDANGNVINLITHLQKDSVIIEQKLNFCSTSGYHNKEESKHDVKKIYQEN